MAEVVGVVGGAGAAAAAEGATTPQRRWGRFVCPSGLPKSLSLRISPPPNILQIVLERWRTGRNISASICPRTSKVNPHLQLVIRKWVFRLSDHEGLFEG